MNVSHEVIEKEFDVIGISIRTTNKAAIVEGAIRNFWQQFFEESVLTKIPNKVDSAIIAVYCDYENDKNGEYTLLIGAKVSSISEVPKGMVAYRVPGQKRAAFFADERLAGHAIFDLWRKIWIMEDQNQLNRSYTADYELYDVSSKDSQNAHRAIHIGTK